MNKIVLILLSFLAITTAFGQVEPDSIWGDNYYVAGLYQGKFKLSNGNAYGHNHEGGIVETDLITKIQKARGLN